MKVYFNKLGGHCVQIIFYLTLVGLLAACAGSGGSGGSGSSSSGGGVPSSISQRADNITNGEPIDSNLTDGEPTDNNITDGEPTDNNITDGEPIDSNITFVDTDGDGLADYEDLDADGDGLIEIFSAEQLNMLRYNLAGTGLSNVSGEQGNVNGCNGDPDLPDSCLGYELMNSISLQDYPNWVPIGACSGRGTFSVPICPAATIFATTFEGNNHSISDLSITLTDGVFYGVGLFGGASTDAVIRNVGLLDVFINVTDNATSWYVGSLVGVAHGAQINSSYVVGGSVAGNYYVGGLVGATRVGAVINNSHAELPEVSAMNSRVGGLVGNLDSSSIFNSYALTNLVQSVTNIGGRVGGLVGLVTESTISKSLAVNGELRTHPGETYIGGLAGLVHNTEIHSSYAMSGSIAASRIYTGGFAGYVTGQSSIYASAALSKITELNSGADAFVSGFIGDLNSPSQVHSSYVFATGLEDRTNYSGFAGKASRTSAGGVTNSYSVTPIGLIPTNAVPLNNIPINSSYWDSNIGASSSTNASYLAASSRTTTELQSPTEFIADFAAWGQGWCDPVTGFFTTDLDTATAGGYDNNTAWDLGADNQYPALTCIKDLPVGKQRELSPKFLLTD